MTDRERMLRAARGEWADRLPFAPRLDLWHNDFDPSMGMGLGDYYADFVQTEAMALGYTVEQVRAWQPPEPVRKARGGRKKKAAAEEE